MAIPTTTILYNNVNVFSGLSPTPLITRAVAMLQAGERYGQLHTINLRGALTGQCWTFAQKIANQQALLSGFSKDFQTLDICDSGISVLTYPNARIANISFDDGNYGGGMIPYDIAIEIYPSGYFSGFLGVLEPKEEIEFRESKDGILSISHSISARGRNTSPDTNNALDNAKDWVYSRTGWSSQVLPAFISGSAINACLQTQAENIDRLQGTVAITETYTSDMYSISGGTLRYTTEYSSGIDNGISTISVQGSIKGCRGGSIDGLRARYLGFDAYSQALTEYQRITSQTDLYVRPISKSVAEDTQALRQSFSFIYNNDPDPTVNFVYDISFNYDFENDVITAAIQGVVSSRDIVENRWAEVLSFANQLNLYSLVVPAYNAYVADIAPHLASYPLNLHSTNKSRTDNQFTNQITMSETFNNYEVPPPGLDIWQYSLNFQPALHQYSPNPILDGQGQYYIFDLGFAKRAVLSLSANAQGSIGVSQNDVVGIVKNQLLAIQNSYFSGTRKVLDEQSVTIGNAFYSEAVAVSATYSAEQTEFSF